MPKIIKSEHSDKELTKEQKAFNNYIKNIKAAKESFEHLKEVNQWLMAKGDSIIRPAHEKLMAVQKKMLISLDSSPFIEKLSKKQYEKFEAIMLEGLTVMIADGNDEELLRLHDKYSEIPFSEQKDASMSVLNEMMGQMFGIDVDFTAEELENPALLQEKMRAIQEEKAAEEAEREAKRKKTAKQLEKEAKVQEAEKKLTQTTKKIYLELVKNFHPDQEQDELEREKKTVILQEANAAYANDDFLALLELQIRLFQEKEEALSKTSDETLKYYNKILKDQLAELKYKLNGLDPRFNGHPYGMYYNATQSLRTEKKMKAEAKEKVEMANGFEIQMRYLKDWHSFKEYIMGFQLQDDELDMSDLFDIFGRK